MIEVTVVLVLISIIAAAVFARSISTDQINITGEVDKIRNHIRYAQSLAIKRNEIRGIKMDESGYWMFTGLDPDDASNQLMLPGETTVKISPPYSVSMTPDNTVNTVFFDKYGKPYSAYTDELDNSPLSSGLTITIGGSPHSLTITPETGLITTQ